MIGNAIAGWIGSKIDRRDGEGGTLGAIAGVASWQVAKKAVPVMVLLGTAALGARYLSKRFSSQP